MPPKTKVRISAVKQLETENVESNPEHFDVDSIEKILDKRTNADGSVDYFLKWKGQGEEKNTWMPTAMIDCKYLDLFEAQCHSPRTVKENEQLLSSTDHTVKQPDNDTGFNNKPSAGRGSYSFKLSTVRGPLSSKSYPRNTHVRHQNSSHPKQKSAAKKMSAASLVPEKIINAFDSCGQLMFLIKMKGTQVTRLVTSKQANILCPQIVIKFYEQRLKWYDPSKPNVNDD